MLAFAAATTSLLLNAPAAHAGTDPLHDGYATGALTFCNEAGHPVTSGSIETRPFIWRVVSTTPAPTGDDHAKTTLMAYQPRKRVDPGNWSGMPLTGSSVFTNPEHPMAAATYGDRSLADFVQAYPPQWDGLVQLRLAFTDPTGSNVSTYPAAVVRVSGPDWTLVSGGGAPCTSGRALSTELGRLPREHLDRPRTPAQRAARAAAFAAVTAGASSRAPRLLGPPPVSTPSAHGSGLHATRGIDTALVWVAGSGALAIAAGAVWFLARRRRRAG